MLEKEIILMKGVKELAYFLIIQNASMSSSYADVCTALWMFLTIPVTTAKAELFFQNRNWLRSICEEQWHKTDWAVCHYYQFKSREHVELILIK